MRLALVYLFEAEISRACVQLSARIAASCDAVAQLGEQAQPHLTLLHVESNGDPAAIWREAVDRLPSELTFELLAFAALRQDVSPIGGGMAWLVVPCTPALRDAEERALALTSLRGSRLHTLNGDRFQPHLTLALWDGEPALPVLPWPNDLVPRQGVRGRLALGEIGPYGTYRSTFHSV